MSEVNTKPHQHLLWMDHTFIIPDLKDDALTLYSGEDYPSPTGVTIYRIQPAVMVFSQQVYQKNRTKILQWKESYPSEMAAIILIGDLPEGEDMANFNLVLPATLTSMEIVRASRSVFQFLEQKRKNISLKDKLDHSYEDFQRLTTVSQALGTERNFEHLIGLILLKARELVSADSGSIYLTESQRGSGPPTHIRFKKSSMSLEGAEFLLPIDRDSIAGYVALTAEPLVIDDVYSISGDSSFSFNSSFDRENHYHTKSMMVMPMLNHSGKVIGVLQLINRKVNFNKELTYEEMVGDQVIPFNKSDFEVLRAMGGMAATAIENQRLLDDQKNLLESIIRLIAGAIDSKSPYTGGHCERVPILTEMITNAVCESEEPLYKNFQLTEDEWYELKIASWLHDCGKIVTPVHIMDKGTKLESLFDRIETIRLRLDLLRRDVQIRYLKVLRDPENPYGPEEERDSAYRELNEIQDFLEKVNIGGEFLKEEDKDRLNHIAEMNVQIGNEFTPLLSREELENLSISRGTLTAEERLVINGHIVETIRMLESLPFPEKLARVPEYAGGHHEKMDGQGYPKGIYAGDMSIPARAMAIADVFEALTATDRPYKKGKSLAEAMTIMGYMKRDNHIDPDLFNLFIRSGVYRQYAEKFLDASLLDEVDEESLIRIEPRPFTLPPEKERQHQKDAFLSEYNNLRQLTQKVNQPVGSTKKSDH